MDIIQFLFKRNILYSVVLLACLLQGNYKGASQRLFMRRQQMK